MKTIDSAQFCTDYDFVSIKKQLTEAALRIFGANMVFSLFSGSVAYGGGKIGKSDIDVMIILLNKNVFTLNQYLEFGKEYININHIHGFVPDKIFPGEIITLDSVEDAISGRGFSVKSQELYLSPASEEYYMRSSEHWFRAWLSMLAFSVVDYGEHEVFLSYKIRAWRTVILYLLRHVRSEVSAESILELLLDQSNKWIGFGITSNYVKFEEFESRIITQVLRGLEKEGFLFKNSLGLYSVQSELLQEWSKEMASAITKRIVRKSELLFNLADASEVSKEMEKHVVE